MMKLLLIFMTCLVGCITGCTNWSSRELTDYEKMQIMARDYHFEYIQKVGYEERKPKINRKTKRKRYDLDRLDRQLRQLRHNRRVN